MAIKEQRIEQPPLSTPASTWPWLNIGLTAVFIGIGFWYITTQVSLADISTAFTQANLGFILLSISTMVITIALKTFRWHYLFPTNHDPIPYRALLWATLLGQYVNTIVPFLRLGEIARIYALNHQTKIGKTRTLGTLIIEKTMDMIMIVLNMAILLPFVILPDFINNPGIYLAIIAAIALTGLYLLAFQTDFIIHISRKVAQRLPAKLSQRIMHLITSGLEGLAALRNQRSTIIIIGLSLLIALLSISTPYLLFPAFKIPLGLVEAALLNIAVSVASSPPSTPGKIGIFDGVVVFMLLSFGLKDNSIILSYTIIFHLIIIVPQIILGGLAAARTKWQWRTVNVKLLSPADE